MSNLPGHVRNLLEQRFPTARARTHAANVWATLPDDWSETVFSWLRACTLQDSALLLRLRQAAQLHQSARCALGDLAARHIHDYLGRDHVPSPFGREMAWSQKTRDKAISPIAEFVEVVLRRRGSTHAADEAESWIMAKPLPELSKKASKLDRKVLREVHRQRTLSVLGYLDVPGYEKVMTQAWASLTLKSAKRGANLDALRWSETPRLMPRVGGSRGKQRSDLVADDADVQRLRELRSQSPFDRAGQRVFYDPRRGAKGIEAPMEPHTKVTIMKRLRTLADIPDDYAFDQRACRHRVLTTAWVNGATSDELRDMADHAPDSEVVEGFYLEPLEVQEALRFTDRVLGPSSLHVCERCRLALMPYHRTCPRPGCGEPVPAHPDYPEEASLDAYLEAAASLKGE